MKKTLATARISSTDLRRLQSHLRRTLGCMTLALEAPPTRNGPCTSGPVASVRVTD